MTIRFHVASLALAGIAFAGAAAAQDVTGAGSSFVAPVLAKWAAEYNKQTGVRINYQSVGSGAGIKQIDAKTVDFGASDMPLTDADLAKKGQVQFPVVIGGVIPVVNIKGVAPGQLHLNGPVLADIYLGKVTRWNDPALKALNPGVNLPDAAITSVHRADGSGTSFIFTNYLSKVSPDWKAKVGEGTSVNWPAGAGGKGNEGVAAFVGRLPNSIGYVEYAYVKQNRMTYAQMQNAAGKMVAPDDTAFKAAAANADWKKSFFQILTNQPGEKSWPITGTTYVLMHKMQDKPAVGAAVLKFFEWGFQHGDKIAEELDYVPMPDSVKAQIEKLWATEIKDGSGKNVAFK
jgi:phosphate transport system substrate-binding protein